MKSWFIVLLSCSLIVFIAFLTLIQKSTQVTLNKTNQVNVGLPFGCMANDYSGELRYDSKVAIYDGEYVDVSYLSFIPFETRVLGLANEERWVEVDLSDQKLLAWEGDKLFLETAVSTGLPWWPTPQGEFRIWIKLRATRMEGGEGRYYYNLPNVPYVMYFYNDKVPKARGYGLHGAYWHNDFGNPRSHGCVNLPIDIAQQLYLWTSPLLSERSTVVYSDESDPGTRIVIHE